jgi:hypothetical protein
VGHLGVGTARSILAVVLAAGVLGVCAGSASAAACPGANPCPYTSITSTFGRYGVSFFNAQAAALRPGRYTVEVLRRSHRHWVVVQRYTIRLRR